MLLPVVRFAAWRSANDRAAVIAAEAELTLKPSEPFPLITFHSAFYMLS